MNLELSVGMMTKSTFNNENGGLYKNKIITIKRARESEIDMSIKDLSARGFELVSRGSYKESYYNKVYWVKLKCN